MIGVGVVGVAHANANNSHTNLSDDGQQPILIGASTSSSNGGGNLLGGRPTKPVLTTPEKRVRHILSEQRRRNTIRDGYTQLTTMLAPHPSATSRPNGNNAKGKGRSGNAARPKGARGRTKGKGKSGVLFRAVEYVIWLEEGVEDLMAEAEKLQAAVEAQGINVNAHTSASTGGGQGRLWQL